MSAVPTIPLSEFITLQRGFDLPARRRKEGEIPVVASTGIAGYHDEAKVEGPGVVIGRSGSIGGGQYIEGDYWPLNTTLWVKDFKGNDPRFTYYLLKSRDFSRFNAGAGVPTLNRNHIASLRIRKYERAKQERIASVLSAYDDLIENNRRRIQLLEESARLLYKEWFVHLRFPGNEHVKVIDGVPERWGLTMVADVCTRFDDGDWIETKDQGGEDYRLLQVSNIGDNCFVETGNFRYVTEQTFRRLRCNEVVPGDILISRMPKPIGRAWYVQPQPWRMITAVDVTIARPNPEFVDPFYFLYHLNSEIHIARCEAHATGATRPRISRKNMGRLPILRPPRSLMTTFGEFASAANIQQRHLTGQNDRLARARDLVLPRLMNGEVAV